MRYIVGILLGFLYVVIGIAVGFYLRYRTEYHVRKYGNNNADAEKKHGFCWCYDTELPNIVRYWANCSWIAWPFNLTVCWIISPLFRFVIIPLFNYVILPFVFHAFVRPIAWCMECYRKANTMAETRVQVEHHLAVEAETKRLADLADKERHKKVDSAIARADILLKRVDEQVGNYEE